MTQRWFITGTDTEIGKTFASCALLRRAQMQGLRCAGYKPVAAGCDHTPRGWRNSDALALLEHSNIPLSYQDVNPIALPEPTSPHIASQLQGQPIELAQLSAGLRALETRADWLLIEGAGGWHTPLNARHSFADWVCQQRLPVILVVGIKLGCINHAILTAHAIAAARLPLAGWIANTLTPPGRHHCAYLDTLIRQIPAPLIGEIPHSPHRPPPPDCLDLTLLRPDNLIHP